MPSVARPRRNFISMLENIDVAIPFAGPIVPDEVEHVALLCEAVQGEHQNVPMNFSYIVETSSDPGSPWIPKCTTSVTLILITLLLPGLPQQLVHLTRRNMRKAGTSRTCQTFAGLVHEEIYDFHGFLHLCRQICPWQSIHG